MDEARKRALLEVLVDELVSERGEGLGEDAPANLGTDDLWHLFRSYVNTRPPWPARRSFLVHQNELLQGMIAEAGIHTLEDATPAPGDAHLLLWRGDITTLQVDVIVNAANSRMLGCWVPGHHCIDNAIHTFAGVQLRAECARLMEAQGHDEATGRAKVTDAYNLPCGCIIHTVGPIANGSPTLRNRVELEQCYRACLNAASQRGLRSITFCCISTGVFGFPADQACGIAVRSVRNWLDENPGTSVRQVVFDVFTASDEALYARELAYVTHQLW